MIIVPDAFATAAIARDGDIGRRWILALPELVYTLCKQWNLAIEGLVMHGYLSLVIPVSRGGEHCVLKVGWIDESTVDEATALAAWEGRGAVRLLEVEPSLGSMLLERLDSQRTLDTVEIGEAVVIAGRLLRRLAIPAPDSLRPLPVVAKELAQSLPQRWERYGRPAPRHLVERACDYAAAFGPSSANLLVNYDLHYADVLGGEREPWLVVDPKVVAGDPEYGIAQLLWRRLEEIQSHGGLERHFHLLVEAAELELRFARAWTLVRCVDYWLWGASVGLTEDPKRCEFIANWLLQGEDIASQ